jgi:Zn-finger nucleic acid-binding protein
MVKCENCGASMDLVQDRDHFICKYCSAVHFPRESRDGVRVLGDETRLACSLCNLPLLSGAIEGVPVLVCDRCHGILLSQAELVGVLRARRARMASAPEPITPLDRAELKRRVDCPRCARTMDTYPYHGPGHVVIDTCVHCAMIWLDRGEMAQMASAARFDRL